MTHTKDMLADELMKLGLAEMEAKARDGYYHDYLSPLAMPETQLVNDLSEVAVRYQMPLKGSILALRQRVINGDFDASEEESREWAKSEEAQEIFRQLVQKP